MDSKYEILIVDDEAGICQLLEDFILDHFPGQFEVKWTAASEKALDILEQHNINILVTDLNMPVISGEALLRKALDLHKGIQIIVLTGDDSLMMAVKCFLQGASRMVRKPINEDLLQQAIESCLVTVNHWQSLMDAKGAN